MVQNRNILKIILLIVGGVLIFGVYGWGRSGYYTRDLPVMGILLVAGCICIFISVKMKTPPKKGEEIPLSDKWKCRCGSYNGKTAEACWNCGEKKPIASD